MAKVVTTILSIITFLCLCHNYHIVTVVDASILVAIKFDHGIVVGSDTRTILSSSSSYVNHPNNLYQVIPMNHHVLLARSGVGNDDAYTQYLVQQVQQMQHTQHIRYNRYLSVSQIAHYVRNIVNADDAAATNYMELLIVGMNPMSHMHQIYTISSSGAIIALPDHIPFATAGTGSVYVTGYLQEVLCTSSSVSSSDDTTSSTLQTASKLLQEVDAIRICHRAIQIAMENDHQSGSGTKICLYIIKRKRINDDDTKSSKIINDNNNDDDTVSDYTCIAQEYTVQSANKKQPVQKSSVNVMKKIHDNNNNDNNRSNIAGFSKSIPYIKR